MINRRCRSLLVLVSLALLLAACRTEQQKTTPSGQSDLFENLLAHSKDLGPVPPNRRVTLLLELRDETSARRAADLEAMYDPHSPTFGHFKTPEELAASYGPDPTAVARVQAVLEAGGLTAEWQRGDDWLTVAGPAERMEPMFGVDVHDFVSVSGVRFYASPQNPTLPLSLGPIVRGSGHVSSYPRQHSGATLAAVRAGGLTPDDLLRAYDIKPLRDLGIDGAGETVVFWALGDGFKQVDFDTFTQKFGLPPIQPKVIGRDPASEVDSETEMDVEVVHAIAPKATLVVYTDTNDQVQFLRRMLTENPHAIFSNSWGGCDLQETAAEANAEKQVYDSADQLGATVFFSTGDSGAYECMTKDWGAPPSDDLLGATMPAAAPGVTAVGGTRISLREDGSWYNETAWEEPTGTFGTGGGLSAHFPIPSWQKGRGVQNRFSNGKRQIPDVAADADPSTGVAIFTMGRWGQGGGTSQSAPIWAGITALMNQYLKSKGLHEVGFLNPALYELANTKQPFPPFHDITAGSNLKYPNTPDYDLATGLGSPDVWNLVRDLEAYQRSGHR